MILEDSFSAKCEIGIKLIKGSEVISNRMNKRTLPAYQDLWLKHCPSKINS